MEIKKWSELLDYQTPQWLKEKKFGIYTHWGVYSVPAEGPNVSWYPYRMYHEGSTQYEYHCKHFGHPTEFGYKDFIPMFTGEKFDADEWADLFAKAGAGFAGPVAEHHDGFSLWDSTVNEWNAKNMGPKRDVVGELETAIRKKGMEYMVAFHHAENWKFYPHWVKEYDTSDPKYAGLYGEAHNEDWGSAKRYAPPPISPTSGLNPFAGNIDERWLAEDLPSIAFHERWFEKMREVIDAYHPDYIWFDFGLQFIQESYKRKFLSYYRGQAAQNNQPVAISYKCHDLPNGTGMVDIEQGRFDHQTYHDWITDTTVDAGEAWGYMHNNTYKSSKSLIHYLVDNVSKNGYLLLNVGPRPDGSIPEKARKVLLEMGEWLAENGDAIYDTSPWLTAEEGPTKMQGSGAFCEMGDVEYTARDLRFTMKDNDIFITCLGKPGDMVKINNFKMNHLYPSEIKCVTAMGDDTPLATHWEGNSFIIDTSNAKKNDVATVLKLTRVGTYEQ